MKKQKSGIRRVAALVCSVALLATLLPVQTFAAGDGTSPSVIVNNVNPDNGEEMPDPEVSCTKAEDCQAETHKEGCPKYVDPDGEGTPDPVVSCTKTEDCQAETHEEGCPKYEAPDGDETPDPVVSCTKTEDCQADTHEEGCPKYEAPDGEGDTNPEVSAPESDTLTRNKRNISNGEEKASLSGTCGAQGNENNVFWELTQNNQDDQTPTYTLTISGSGAMMGYDSASQVPWYSYADQITIGIVEEGISDLGARTFVLQKKLTSVQLPQSLQSIGESAFNQCGLKTIDLPSNLKVIGPSAFWKGNLEGAIKIPETVEIIDSGAFQGCALTEVILPKNLKVLGGGAFKETAITKMPEIPAAITSLSCTFQNCTKLTEISIPEQVTELDRTFMGCTSLTSVTIPETVESYVGVFNGCTGLMSATIESKADNIGGENDNNAFGVFGGCTNLKTVVVPEWVKIIGVAAFKNCSSLTTTDFIEKAEVIGLEAFQGCTALTGDLNLEAKELGARAFDRCSGLGPNISIANVSVSGGDVFRNATNIDGIVYASKVSGGANMISARSVTAITNGGVIPRETVLSKESLATPVYEGRIFDGWYSKDGTQDGQWGEVITTPEDRQTYYAKWIGMKDLTLQYGETQQISSFESNITIKGCKSENEDVAIVTETGQVTATGIGTTKIIVTGTYNENEQETIFKMNVSVTPRSISYSLVGDDSSSGSIIYNYSEGHHALSDSMVFKWADGSNTEVTLVEGTDIDYTYTVTDPEGQGGGSSQTYGYLPMPVGEYTVSFNLKNPNYTFALSDSNTNNTLTIRVKVTEANTQRAYLASAAPKADQNFIYNGQGLLPVEGTLNAYAENSTSSTPVEIGDFTVNVEGLNDTTFHSEVSVSAGTDFSAISDLALPTDPGTYIITASAANEDYYLYKSLVFVINKATVTITATDKTAVVGADLPDLSNPVEGEDYTVTGLVGSDRLTTNPTLAYADGASTGSAATYDIVPAGAAVDEQYYNAQIQYVNGTLKVEGLAIIAGANQTWTQGSGKDLVITSNADYDDFKKVTVNGETLAQGQDYTVREGSTIVTLKASYLDGLAVGDYTFAIVSKPGAASTRFTVKAKAADDSETTGGNGSGSSVTTTQSGSTTPYYTCPACGYHNWTATADGYKCNHCGYLESVKQLSSYGNVKGVYEPKAPAAAAPSAAASGAAIPQTGDTLPVGLLGGVAVVAVAAFVVLLVLRKRKHDD